MKAEAHMCMVYTDSGGEIFVKVLFEESRSYSNIPSSLKQEVAEDLYSLLITIHVRKLEQHRSVVDAIDIKYYLLCFLK